MGVDYFKTDYPALARDLASVRKRMKKTIAIKNPLIEAAIFDVLDAGGKMLRPAYLLLFSELVGLEEELKLNLAAAVEMLHTATLVHDDVIDKANIRRGVATISSRYGVDSAVYAGDYLFVCAVKLLAKYSESLSHLTDQLGSVERLLNGEIGQMNERFDLTQSITSYLENIEGKTAELFAVSCSVGPLVAGNKRLAQTAHDVGLAVGTAFQIMDDYLDYASSSESLGKPVLEDIKQGVYSAPAIYALEADARVAAAIRQGNVEAVYELVHATGALDKTKKLAASYTTKALKLIGKLPESEAQTALADITEKLLERVV
ncbi:MAG: polyprenyl synthetase family protein [Streptococcaceae bacterium]|jgi:heptaprenyl diphosphate synthase|nr:polyprenyl synthetase family protein [Streptococcaceae bacterium]